MNSELKTLNKTMTTTQETSIYSTALDTLMDAQKLPADIVLKKQVAISQFEQLGLPSMKHEEWKYTYLAKILKKGFVPAFVKNDEISLSAIEDKLPKTTNGSNRIVLIDGVFSSELSKINASEQYIITSLANSWNLEIHAAIDLFSSLTKGKKQALTALNTALCQDGLYIEVSEGGSAHVELYFVLTGRKIISMPRFMIHVGQNAYLNIAEQYLLLDGESMTNSVSEVFLDKSAKLEWVKIQDAGEQAYQIDSNYVVQADKSQYHCSTISLTGELLRNNQFIQIAGEEAHANLGGVYILDDEQQADNLIIIEHASPNATSNQLYKGILDGKSTGVFNGKIVVVEDAQKTNAFQSNKNILLSDDAAAFFRPQLEIFADDVKCSHGATSSQIEDHELFYLRSRGIGKDLSKSLLMFAFVADVIEEIENTDLREWVKSRIASKLKIDF